MSDEWLTTGIFAEDAAIIAGYDTSKKIERRMKEREKGKNGYMLTRDRELYPRAKGYYELMVGFDIKPIRVESEEFPMLRDVLDGINNDVVSMIKIVGAKTVDREQVPPKYWAQAQYKMAITGANTCNLFLYDGNRFKLYTIGIDQDASRSILESCIIYDRDRSGR